MVDGLVSVITPCYNGSRYIAETIESVISQSYTSWEMIIVDDGSTDDSADIIRRYAALDNRIRLISKVNGGSAAARNAGIREARGQYIALLDADDLWDADFLAGQIHFMNRHKAICVCSSYRIIDESSEWSGRIVHAKFRISKDDMKITNQIGCLTGLYDTSRYGKIYLHEELKSLRDDYAYWYDIVALTGAAYGNPEVLAGYRVFRNSTTGKKLKLIKVQYHFYRDYLNESIPAALLNLGRWGLRGIRKYHGKTEK